MSMLSHKIKKEEEDFRRHNNNHDLGVAVSSSLKYIKRGSSDRRAQQEQQQRPRRLRSQKHVLKQHRKEPASSSSRWGRSKGNQHIKQQDNPNVFLIDRRQHWTHSLQRLGWCCHRKEGQHGKGKNGGECMDGHDDTSIIDDRSWDRDDYDDGFDDHRDETASSTSTHCSRQQNSRHLLAPPYRPPTARAGDGRHDAFLRIERPSDQTRTTPTPRKPSPVSRPPSGVLAASTSPKMQHRDDSDDEKYVGLSSTSRDSAAVVSSVIVPTPENQVLLFQQQNTTYYYYYHRATPHPAAEVDDPAHHRQEKVIGVGNAAQHFDVKDEATCVDSVQPKETMTTATLADGKAPLAKQSPSPPLSTLKVTQPAIAKPEIVRRSSSAPNPTQNESAAPSATGGGGVGDGSGGIGSTSGGKPPLPRPSPAPPLSNLGSSTPFGGHLIPPGGGSQVTPDLSSLSSARSNTSTGNGNQHSRRNGSPIRPLGDGSIQYDPPQASWAQQFSPQQPLYSGGYTGSVGVVTPNKPRFGSDSSLGGMASVSSRHRRQAHESFCFSQDSIQEILQPQPRPGTASASSSLSGSIPKNSRRRRQKRPPLATSPVAFSSPPAFIQYTHDHSSRPKPDGNSLERQLLALDASSIASSGCWRRASGVTGDDIDDEDSLLLSSDDEDDGGNGLNDSDSAILAPTQVSSGHNAHCCIENDPCTTGVPRLDNVRKTTTATTHNVSPDEDSGCGIRHEDGDGKILSGSNRNEIGSKTKSAAAMPSPTSVVKDTENLSPSLIPPATSRLGGGGDNASTAAASSATSYSWMNDWVVKGSSSSTSSSSPWIGSMATDHEAAASTDSPRDLLRNVPSAVEKLTLAVDINNYDGVSSNVDKSSQRGTSVISPPIRTFLPVTHVPPAVSSDISPSWQVLTAGWVAVKLATASVWTKNSASTWIHGNNHAASAQCEPSLFGSDLWYMQVAIPSRIRKGKGWCCGAMRARSEEKVVRLAHGTSDDVRSISLKHYDLWVLPVSARAGHGVALRRRQRATSLLSSSLAAAEMGGQVIDDEKAKNLVDRRGGDDSGIAKVVEETFEDGDCGVGESFVEILPVHLPANRLLRHLQFPSEPLIRSVASPAITNNNASPYGGAGFAPVEQQDAVTHLRFAMDTLAW